MSESGEEHETPQMTEDEVSTIVTEKVFNAFKEFDRTGSGTHVKSDQIRALLEHIDIKVSDQEIFQFISDIDPNQTGYIEANAFRAVMIEKEIKRLCSSDEEELMQAFIAMGG